MTILWIQFYWLIAGILALVGAGSIAIWKFWDDLKIKLNGKRIIILGSNATGKTVLYTFLTKGEFTEEYKPSFFEKTEKTVFKMEDLELNLKGSVDFGGNTDTNLREQWRKSFLNSDYCIYNINCDFFYHNKENNQNVIESHLNMITGWIETYKSKTKIIILPVFADKIDNFPKNYKKIDKDIREHYYDLIHQLNCPLLVGSMKDYDSTVEIVKKILKVIINSK